MAAPAACECGAEDQTADHVVLQYPIHRPSLGLYGLTVMNDETIDLLLNTEMSAAQQCLKELAQTMKQLLPACSCVV